MAWMKRLGWARGGVLLAAVWMAMGCAGGRGREVAGRRGASAAMGVERPTRLSNLDLQTAWLPEVAVVQVYDVGGTPAERAEGGAAGVDLQKAFPLRPYGADIAAGIQRVRTLQGKDAEAFAALWRRIEFAGGLGLFCHHPAYAFRCFDARGQLVFETSVCWGCCNFFLRHAGGYTWHGFNPNGPGSKALYAYCERIMKEPTARPPGEAGAERVLVAEPTAYVPDELDAYNGKRGEITDADLIALRGFSGLQELDVASPAVTDAGLRALATLGGLRSLMLRTPGISEAGLASLRGLRRLRELSFIDTPLTDRSLASVADLTELGGLYLGGDATDPNRTRGVTDAGLAHLARLTGLHSLSLYGCGVTDAGIGRLAHLAELEYLSLERTEVKGLGLERLRGLPHLKELHLERADVTDAGMTGIAALPELEMLYLDHVTGLSDAGLAAIARCPKLYRISLEGTRITDAGLAILTAAPKLEYLHLSGTKITDAGIRHLQAMKQLKALWIGATKMTEEGMKRLERPGLTVQR